ncbi:MAG: glycosyltransferase family 4 protein [Pseudomonadota bacterium]
MARILVLSFGVVPAPNRHAVQLLHVLKALASRFTVDVLTLRAESLAFVERFQRTRMLRVPMPDGSLSDKIAAFRRAIRRQIESTEYEVVHFRDAWGGLPVVERSRELGLRTVFEPSRSVLAGARPIDVTVLADLIRDEAICLERADLVIVPSEDARAALVGRGRIDRVAAVPPGVDIDRFDAESFEEPEPPRIVYVGILAPGRGVELLLEAMRHLQGQAEARLVLAGPMEKRFLRQLASLTRNNGIEDKVEILGSLENEDVPHLLSRATVCVAPAAVDSTSSPAAGPPTKLLEYAACCRPFVAPRSRTVSSLFKDGVHGLLFRPDDAKDLAEQIARLLRDAALRDQLASAAYRRVRECHTASILRRRIVDCYAGLVRPSISQSSSPSSSSRSSVLSGSGGTVAAAGPAPSGVGARDTSPGIVKEVFDATPPEGSRGLVAAVAASRRLLASGEDEAESSGVVREEDAAITADTDRHVSDARASAAASSDGDGVTASVEDSGQWIAVETETWAAELGRGQVLLAPPREEEDGEATPTDGSVVAAKPKIGHGFVAGEIEIRGAGRPLVVARESQECGAAVPIEIPGLDETLVVAGELLGGSSAETESRSRDAVDRDAADRDAADRDAADRDNRSVSPRKEPVRSPSSGKA